MKCEQCHENDATVFIQSIANGVKKEQRLCSSCACDAIHEGDDSLVNPLFAQSMPAGVFHVLGGIPSFGAAPSHSAPVQTCPSCGTTYEDFRKTGLIGCAGCYDAFADHLEQIFARVQASGRHTGRKCVKNADMADAVDSSVAADAADAVACPVPPENGPPSVEQQMEALRCQLRQAVAAEDYEEAVKLRDLIREAGAVLERKGEKA